MQSYKETFFAMNTVMEITVYSREEQEVAAVVVDEIRRLEGLFSVTDPQSDVGRLNRAAGEELTVSPDTVGILSEASELSRRTDGTLDITLYPIVKAWGFTQDSFRIPPQQELDGLLKRVDWRAVVVDAAQGSAALPPMTEIDLGAVAKGYAARSAAKLLEELGVSAALLNLGGNIQTVGQKPDSSSWHVGVQDPNDMEQTLGTLEVEESAAVVTSGGYERYFERDGVRYWHIMDPKTGAPARSGLLSVTVVGEDGLLCDALSTALFVMGAEEAIEHWRSWRDFEAILVAQDGTVYVTGGLENRFTLADTSRYALTIVK